MQTEQQKTAFDKLNSLYDQYSVRPKKYGFTERSYSNSKPYDTPGHRLDWSKDKRLTHIPIYRKEEDETEGTKVD